MDRTKYPLVKQGEIPSARQRECKLFPSNLKRVPLLSSMAEIGSGALIKGAQGASSKNLKALFAAGRF
jgi:hypothetical protein